MMSGWKTPLRNAFCCPWSSVFSSASLSSFSISWPMVWCATPPQAPAGGEYADRQSRAAAAGRMRDVGGSVGVIAVSFGSLACEPHDAVARPAKTCRAAGRGCVRRPAPVEEHAHRGNARRQPRALRPRAQLALIVGEVDAHRLGRALGQAAGQHHCIRRHPCDDGRERAHAVLQPGQPEGHDLTAALDEERAIRAGPERLQQSPARCSLRLLVERMHRRQVAGTDGADAVAPRRRGRRRAPIKPDGVSGGDESEAGVERPRRVGGVEVHRPAARV